MDGRTGGPIDRALRHIVMGAFESVMRAGGGVPVLRRVIANSLVGQLLSIRVLWSDSLVGHEEFILGQLVSLAPEDDQLQDPERAEIIGLERRIGEIHAEVLGHVELSVAEANVVRERLRRADEVLALSEFIREHRLAFHAEVGRLADWSVILGIDPAEAGGGSYEFVSQEAEERGWQLLMENLTPRQRKQLERRDGFVVVGGETGRKYRICRGRQMNIEVLSKAGRRRSGLCFLPQGALATGDVMLGQKIALETYEYEALSVANEF